MKNEYRGWNRIPKPYAFEDGFRCLHCGVYITCDPAVSGVQNRNHCPYCLHSRHLDLFAPGDRLAACKSEMQPVGLTLKRSKKRYARQASGELMLVHRCTGCGKIAINRIAADDIAETLMEVFEASTYLAQETCTRLSSRGVQLLRAGDYELVARQLTGAEQIRRCKLQVAG